jgi:hypothetical protein
MQSAMLLLPGALHCHAMDKCHTTLILCCCYPWCMSPNLQPENLEKQGRVLPRPVRAWPPRDNGKYDVIGQLPPITQLPQAALPVAAAALSSS